MSEPEFKLYRTERDEVPTVDESLENPDDFDHAKAEPDEVVQGYDALSEILDEAEDGAYRWKEVGAESAPEQSLCSTCDASIKTRSDERVRSLQNAHHAATGH